MNEKQVLSRKLILEALGRYRSLFNKAPNDQALELYADMLSEKFEFKQVTWALTELIKKGSAFYPSCGEIFAILSPVQEKIEDRAPSLANEIITFIRLHHFDLEENYLHKLSTQARDVFLRIGGSKAIRDSENFETMRAQLERSIKSILSSSGAKSRNEKLESIGIKSVSKEPSALSYANFLIEETK